MLGSARQEPGRISSRIRRFGLGAMMIALSACSGAPETQSANVPPQPMAVPAPPAPSFAEVGLVSWYGAWHQGKRTANGERFDARAFTAAHRSLPFGTVLRITDPATGKMVKVRINDRGPYVAGRLLDLSAAAAKALGVAKDGVKRVRIEAYAADQPANSLMTASAGSSAQPIKLSF